MFCLNLRKQPFSYNSGYDCRNPARLHSPCSLLCQTPVRTNLVQGEGPGGVYRCFWHHHFCTQHCATCHKGNVVLQLSSVIFPIVSFAGYSGLFSRSRNELLLGSAKRDFRLNTGKITLEKYVNGNDPQLNTCVLHITVFLRPNIGKSCC